MRAIEARVFEWNFSYGQLSCQPLHTIPPLLPVTACKQILCHIRPLSEASYIFRAFHVTRVHVGFSNARPHSTGRKRRMGFLGLKTLATVVSGGNRSGYRAEISAQTGPNGDPIKIEGVEKVEECWSSVGRHRTPCLH